MCEASEGEQQGPDLKVGQLPGNEDKVAHVVVYAKTIVELDGDTFIHDNMPQGQALWEMATDCIFEFADKSDGSNNEKGEATKISYSYQICCVL